MLCSLAHTCRCGPPGPSPGLISSPCPLPAFLSPPCSAFFTADDLINGMSWEEFLDAADSEGLYVNLHTTAYPGGAIRGQVVPGEQAVAWVLGLQMRALSQLLKVKVGKSLHRLNFPVLTSSFRPLFDLPDAPSAVPPTSSEWVPGRPVPKPWRF